MDKIRNYSYSMSLISNNVTLPVNENDIYCFHGFKDKDYHLTINSDYGKTVLDCEEFLVYYHNNSIFFEKNSFLGNKKIDENVDFIVKTINGEIIQTLTNQELFRYWVFYISNVILNDETYVIEIVKTNSRIKIYNNLLKIK